MKVLVTGGAGFIGSHVVDLLIERGYDVVIIDNLSTGLKENINPKAVFYYEDLSNYNKIDEIFTKEKPEAILHLAAQVNLRKSVEEPILDARVNILNSIFLLELARKFDVKKFIFSSTGGAIYGDATILPTPEEHPQNPQSPYGIAKLAVEKHLSFYNKTHKLKTIALRYANVYGERQDPRGEAGVVALFFDKLFQNQLPIIFGDGNQTRDFVYVKDVAKANLLALQSNKEGTYNVGTGKEVSVIELFNKINSLFENKVIPIFQSKKEFEQLKSCLDWRKVQQELSWQPSVSIDEGLKKCYEWCKERYGKH